MENHPCWFVTTPSVSRPFLSRKPRPFEPNVHRWNAQCLEFPREQGRELWAVHFGLSTATTGVNEQSTDGPEWTGFSLAVAIERAMKKTLPQAVFHG